MNKSKFLKSKLKESMMIPTIVFEIWTIVEDTDKHILTLLFFLNW
jgi:hypothetical protein